MFHLKLCISSKAQKSQLGFSLIEIIGVLAIVGTLLSISVPYYFKAQSRAKTLEVHLRLQAFATALERYYHYYEGFPAFLDNNGPIPLEEHFPELIKMLCCTDLKGEPLKPSDRATLNPHNRSFLSLNPKDYNAQKTCLRGPEDRPIYLKVRQGTDALQLPPPLEEHTTLHRVIVYAYQESTLIGSWIAED